MTTTTRGLATLVGTLSTTVLIATSAFGTPAPDQPDPSPTGTSPAALAAAVPDDASAVELLPGVANVAMARIADDAVYLMERGDPSSTLWRRPLTTGPEGTYVGAASAITDIRTLGTSVLIGFAEHDGTLAYARASDGRLALRDPAGTETVPTWAAAAPFDHSVSALTADWLTTTDAFDTNPLVWNVHTGVQVPLSGLTPVQPGFPVGGVTSVAISDTRAVWTVEAWNASARFAGVYTVALDPADADGAVGDVTTLASTTFAAEGGTYVSYGAAGADGGLAAWTCQGCTPGGQRTLRWFSAPPYTGTPAGPVELTSRAFGLDGTTLATPVGASSVEWYDLSGWATTPVRTWSLPGSPVASAARFVVSVDGSGGYWLSDSTGGVVSDKPLPTDIHAGDPFGSDIYWLVARAITGGYADGTFRPRASVNRDAMAAFLYRMGHGGADAPDCTAAAFTDVPATHPLCGEIAWLASTGITTGWPDGTFRPSQPVTREAMAAFLYRFAHDGATAPACSSAPFTDVGAADPFCGEIAWMASSGISTGWPDHTFRPGLTIERQAMAAFLHRYRPGVS